MAAYRGVVIEVSKEDRAWFRQWTRELAAREGRHVTSIEAFGKLRALAEKEGASR